MDALIKTDMGNTWEIINYRRGNMHSVEAIICDAAYNVDKNRHCDLKIHWFEAETVLEIIDLPWT